MHTDPFLEYEELILREVHEPKTIHRIFGVLRFLSLYLILSGTIFSLLLGALNFSAYSNRFLSWIDPARFEQIRSDLEGAIAQSSIEAHAADMHVEDRSLPLDILEEKIAQTDPDLIYSRTYTPDRLLGSINNESSSRVSFAVTPYENRIIIPKLGKNIPLVDVDHDQDASYTEMHEIFMEELKK